MQLHCSRCSPPALIAVACAAPRLLIAQLKSQMHQVALMSHRIASQAVMVQAFVHLPAPAALEPDDESVPLRSGLSGSGIGTPQHCSQRGSISDSAMSTPKSSQPGNQIQ